MQIPNAIERLKEYMIERQRLIGERQGFLKSIWESSDFFRQQGAVVNVNAGQWNSGVTKLKQTLEDMAAVDRQIFDIDTFIATALESMLIDDVLKIQMEDKVNAAGDLIENQTFYFVPEHSNSGMAEITPEDLFILKLLKPTFSVKNLEVINKRDYYKH